ncbi:MAG: hypothetical protein HGB12_08890 [Bacteroidetes bacterium]|nr:hypothetical protein [Bacteroidota bacterium]
MNNRKLFIICIATMLMFNSFAQTRISSPYSRYGIGDLQNDKCQRNLSIGGISFGYRNSSSVNYTNPASYTVFDTASFVFETGINSRFTQISSNSTSQKSNYTSLGYIVMGFPVTKWWGASAGLLPYSSVGYKISDSDNKTNVGNINYLYEGDGGLSQFYFGNSFEPFKGLSLGFNASYLFGYLNKTRTVSFPDSVNFLNLRIKNSTIVSDLLLNYGIQYEKSLGSNLKMVAGFVLNTPAKLSAKQDTLAYHFFASNSEETIKDTIIKPLGSKGSVTLPLGLGGGITIGKPDSWLFGVDFQTQNWEKYSSFGEKDSLKNTWMASFGGEFTPKNSISSSYFKKIHYRIGGRYNKTYLQLRNNQLTEVAFSFGFGLPLKRSKTSINLGFEIGQRGTTKDNLIKENFGRLTLSLSIYEYWFFKRRFD